MIAVLDADGNVEAIVSTLEGLDLGGKTTRPATEADLPSEPRWRTSRQIFDLFTADEKAAILTSGIKEVIGLVLALQMAERVDLDSSFHQQGVALLAGLNLITPARAAVVLAGEPPE